MPLPPEYVELLTNVVECLGADAQTPLRTADEVIEWLHNVAAADVRDAVTDHDGSPLMRRMAQCLLEKTHHPLLSDWTPEQIAEWCNRTNVRDVQAVFAGRQTA